ncbi:glucosamine-6-phosphate deaminase [Staphylococcus condimenti]|uniref:Glucosamine-6-phosphate deaminase n=1 Tax=Staphylococcus condimenti TaxID=70255 RepID=A0A143PAR0_9STAP|nr:MULTISPECIES: glucosamine-6-phosphate deaminase [Staphylococcus]AMY05615.1 glucosamine-6-phosphate deaminase [Staphylococcus condimenti]APR61822.1 glucosamine-6-phosphate deaminase [Staphylococcus condimenti]MDK8645641.1 glucosamine-6-phosphate deaminase [Staphylococcus condimenti]OFO99402.1 glucosamine-6-phosphate deaminase [Staphylococcus sp. HMSC065E08]PNZ59972.1 glucosamine-6-phosphate deaminase [Staphylococcus condimenti]
MEIINLGNRHDASFYAACELFNQITRNPESKLGLATGGTMVDVYANFVNLLKMNDVDVSNVETFNLDEYVGLPQTHPESYHQYMQEVLFEQYPYFTASNIHIPTGDAADLNDEAKRYEAVVHERGPVDIQILGIGENGHIGFNEPGTSKESETRVVDLTESTIRANSRYFDTEDEVPKQAVSMGLSTIMSAKRIILLAFGEKKKAAITKLASGIEDADVPATILYEHPNVEVYVDEAAAPDDMGRKE